MSEKSKFQVRPLYLQVRDALMARIKDGTWSAGGSLPSEIDLYRDLGVSLGTLRKALGVLEAEKLIVRQPGRGTFVRNPRGARARQAARTRRDADPAPAREDAARAGSRPKSSGAAALFQVRPLYLQVRDALIERVKDGRWSRGSSIPSEIDLYQELGVSLGTLRKALGVLEAEKLIVRQPGRGTFISDYRGERPLGRFDPLRSRDGGPVIGEVRKRTAKLASPSPAERSALRLGTGERIIRIQQVRFHGPRPLALEMRSMPDKHFPGYFSRRGSPNEIDKIAQEWGVVLGRAEVRLRMAAASAAASGALSLADRTQVLVMDRVVYDTDDAPVEAMTAWLDLADEYCWVEMR